MTLLLPMVKARFFDSNGDPLSGGKVYTYAAGTTTNKATYTDSSGNVANANPVILDSEGYGNIWLGEGDYKIVLKNASDVTQFTVDNVAGDSATGFASEVYSLSTSTNITDSYDGGVLACTGTINLALLPVAIAQEGFALTVLNNGTGSVTIDPDSSETINGASTLVLRAGESCLIVCDGTNWVACLQGQEDRTQTSLASGATTDLGTVKQRNVLITGTTTITSFGSSASVNQPIYYIEFLGALTLTHNATSLIIPGGANITTAAGDTAIVQYLGSGNWRVRQYAKSSGNPVSIQTATDTTVGGVEKATAAETAAETADRYPDAALLKNHPGVAKAWVTWDGTTGTIKDSYNVSSVTRHAVGNYTINFTNAFANANYAALGMSIAGGGTPGFIAEDGLTVVRTTSALRVLTMNSTSGANADRAINSMVFYGDI